MDITNFAEKHGQIDVFKGVSGAKLTTFRSGGEIAVMLCPKGAEALADLVSYLCISHERYAVLGGGSNVVISDRGLKVPVISLKSLNKVVIEDDILYAEGGAKLPTVATAAQRAGLSGLEFMCGIPATIGGAVKQNAGAYGTETADKLLFTDILTDGCVSRVYNSELGFGYRSSGFKGIVLGAAFRLTADDSERIFLREEELLGKRRRAQPLAPSAGSVFKRADGVSAGYYVDGAGLKGTRIGGAEISSVHANFIINRGGATTCDFLALSTLAAEEVYKKYGIALKKEVIYFGDEVFR